MKRITVALYLGILFLNLSLAKAAVGGFDASSNKSNLLMPQKGWEYITTYTSCPGGGIMWVEIAYYNGRAIRSTCQNCDGTIDSYIYTIVAGTGGGTGTPTTMRSCGSETELNPTMWTSWITQVNIKGHPTKIIGQDCDGEYYIATY